MVFWLVLKLEMSYVEWFLLEDFLKITVAWGQFPH